MRFSAYDLPRCIILLSLMLLLSGCEKFAFDYICRGQLRHVTGEPFAGAVVHVDTRGDRRKGSTSGVYWWEITGDAAQADARGRFTAHCTGDLYTISPLQWKGPPAPSLSRVYVWVRLRDDWLPFPVELDHASEARAGPGYRELLLPQIAVP